eukprot:scaffold21148_cov107-Phaeocystis_antarctica.AAC.3
MARQVGEDRRKGIGSDALATVEVHRDRRLRCVARELGAGVAHAALEDEHVARAQVHRPSLLEAEVAVGDGDEH